MSSCEQFVNLTGVLNPDLIAKDALRHETHKNGQRLDVLRNCLDDREILLAGEERRWFFWNSGGEKVAEAIIEASNRRLSPYGVPPLRFEKRGIHFISGFPETDYVSGEIFIPSGVDLRRFAKIYAHELLHTAEARIFRRTRGDYLERYRIGLCSYPECEFRFLHEGTVERTAREILEGVGIPVNWKSYNEEVRLIDLMCRKMNPKDPEAAFHLFERASYGRGELLPLARAIDRTWKQKGGFSKFRQIAGQCAKECVTKGRYKKLREFIKTKKPR